MTLAHFDPSHTSYWVATARIVIDDEELLCSTAGQVTREAAPQVVARWLYAKCTGPLTAA